MTYSTFLSTFALRATRGANLSVNFHINNFRLASYDCLSYLTASELRLFKSPRATTLRFVSINNTISYMITHQACALPVVSNPLGIQNATHALTFPCGTRSCFWDYVFWLPVAAFSQHIIKHLLARLIPYDLAWSLIPDCSTLELLVLGGTVSRFLTVLPSETIFQPSFRHISTFWMKLTDLASCIVVQLSLAETRWGVFLWPCCHGLS